MSITIYIIVKALAYCTWCYVGVRWFRPESPHPFAAAIGYGLGRLMLGIVLGLFIFMFAVGINNAVQSQALAYLLVYVPVRIGEWSLWYRVVRGRGDYAPPMFWILGGVVVSCLADIPIAIEMGGIIPVGRPFC